MELKIGVTDLICVINVEPYNDESGDMHLESQASINGEIYLCENDLVMPLLSKEDRRELTNRFRDVITSFILGKMGYSISEEDEA